jgi:hypothetical protein
LGATDHLTPRWFTSGRGMLVLWAGVLAGPIAWAADLGVSYAIVKWSCGHQTIAVLRLITLATLAVIAGGAYASWRALSLAPDDVPLDGPPTHAGPVLVLSRARFMAVLGLASSALFAVTVIGMAVPRWVLDACH